VFGEVVLVMRGFDPTIWEIDALLLAKLESLGYEAATAKVPVLV
jgi:hypothetical protein